MPHVAPLPRELAPRPQSRDKMLAHLWSLGGNPSCPLTHPRQLLWALAMSFSSGEAAKWT